MPLVPCPPGTVRRWRQSVLPSPIGRAANKALWEEMAALHPNTELYDMQGVVDGRDDLRPWDAMELGPVDGLDISTSSCSTSSM